MLKRRRRLVIHDFPLPAVGDDDALVRVLACRLCGTDHDQYLDPSEQEVSSRPPDGDPPAHAIR